MLLRMIALRLSIASIDSPLWVNVLRNRFDRFKKMSFSDTESIVIIPRLGAVLITETDGALTVHVVAPDESTLDFIREGIAYEVTTAVPETERSHRLELEWDYPEHVPVPLRQHAQRFLLGRVGQSTYWLVRCVRREIRHETAAQSPKPKANRWQGRKPNAMHVTR